MTRLSTLRLEAAQQLALQGFESPQFEVDLLLGHVLGRSRAWLLTHADDGLSVLQQQQWAACLARRLTHEPLAYIVGHQDFFGETFTVTPGVLIPRADSETVIMATQSLFPQPTALTHFAEIGVGSGALVVTLLRLFPEARALGTDVSPQALACTTQNATCHAVEERLSLHHTSLLTNITQSLDLVVSNPPYIPHQDIAGLDKTVRAFEPAVALDGGADGLDLYRGLIPQAMALLRPGGWCMLEHGYNQAPDVTALLAAGGFKGMVSFKDLGGHWRVTAAQKG